MVIIYIIAKIQEEEEDIDWVKLIEKFSFELFYRLELTDLKPQVFHAMVKDKKKELDEYVLDDLTPILSNFNENFLKKFEEYLCSDKNSIEDKIINAAHYLATDWEFKIIYHSNSFIYGIDKTKNTIERRVEKHFDLEGVKKLLLCKNYYGFIDLCGQLRFQKRWSQTPRVPETSVLGHMLMVAIITYFLTINYKENPSNKRIYNNFFGGLFHDLPEVLTKDIISPIKRSIEGLEDLIGNYEDESMKNDIKPLIPKWFKELSYLTKNEFDNKIFKDGKVESISYEDMDKYNTDEFCPVDGEIIKFADKLAALTESSVSIRYGLESEELRSGYKNLKEELSSMNRFKIDLDNIQ